MVFIALECEVCKKPNALTHSDRYPTLRICTQCVLSFQNWVWRNLGSAYVYYMTGRTAPYNLIKELGINGMFLVNPTTATTVLEYVDNESLPKHSPPSDRHAEPVGMGAQDMAIESRTGTHHSDCGGPGPELGQQAACLPQPDSEDVASRECQLD